VAPKGQRAVASTESRVATLLQNFIDRYLFSESLPLYARKVNVLFAVGLFASVLSLVQRIFLGANPQAIAVIAILVVLLAAFIVVSNRFSWFRQMAWVTTIAICYVLFPIAYFFIGGMSTAITAYFVLSAVVVFVLHDGVARIAMLLIQLSICMFCIVIEIFNPSFVLPLSREQQIGDSISSYIIIALCIGLIIVFYGRIYENDQRRIENKNMLLTMLNDSAKRLLVSGQANFDVLFINAIEEIAKRLNVHRVYIWRRRERDDKVQYLQEYGWSADSNRYIGEGIDEVSGRPFMMNIPEWEKSFHANEVINSPVRLLSKTLKRQLSAHNIKSILVLPIVINDSLWGCINFDDCQNDSRFFTDEEVDILKSETLMLVTAIIRMGNERIIETRLEQQELMSKISQSFISREPMGDLIESALCMVAEFLKATRVTVMVVDGETDASVPVYSWYRSEKWCPQTDAGDLGNIIDTAFPRKMPIAGQPQSIHCNDILSEGEESYRLLKATGLRAFIWTPIYIDDGYWGMISVEDCEDARIWSDSDIVLVETITSAISGGIARDIIDSERAAALEQALLASKAKGDFLSNMSHEMRTPMNAIIGMASIGRSADNIERKDYALDKIETASVHLLGVINDILDMSKIEANKLELSLVDFNYERMLRKVVSVMNFRIDERSQQLRINIDKRIPEWLVGDDQRLAQVITNLLSNAIKFTPEHGVISIDSVLEKIDEESCVLRIEVSDNGIGISAEQQTRLFNSFEQAESTTARRFGGTGLGLAISKRIVELMDGEIGVASKVDEGSSFSFTVKLGIAADHSSGLLNPDIDWGNIRILAVDDDEGVLALFADLAGHLCVTCDTASSAAQAMRLIGENGSYDVYFIDWRMPDVDGIELADRINALEQADGGHSVVTMISATEWTSIQSAAEAAGVRKFLSKPLFPSAIVELISECIGLDMYRSRAGADALAQQFPDCRILLAEDIEINQEIVKTLLEPTQIKLDIADNGKEALRMFQSSPERYDMIFMDVQMPDMDGYDATKHLRAINSDWAKKIPIIAMTANVFREDIEECLAAGMNGHIGKPIALDDVLEKVSYYLKTHPKPKPHV
jgi:signal transduction histidine kinase/CheY-like chemotaxis protein